MKQNGPVQQRSCTDIHCCLLYLVITIGILGIGIYSFTTPNFGKVTVPVDVDGKACGVDPGYTNYGYIYFASPHIDSLWVTTCVSQCPHKNDTSLKCKTNSVVKSCNPSTGSSNAENIEIYQTTGFARICFPSDSIIAQNIAKALSFGGIQDISNSWQILAASVGIAILVGLLFMLFMRVFAGCIIWILIFTTILILILLGAFFFLPSSYLPSDLKFLSHAQSSSKTANYVIGSICCLVALLLIVLSCCWRKKISLASSISKVSAEFISTSLLLLLLPIGLFFAMVIFLILWTFFAVGFYSLGTPVYQAKSLPFQHFHLNQPALIALMVVHIIYLLWTLMFYIQMGAFLIIGAATSFYYGRQHPFAQSSHRFNRYHAGSVIKGAFLWMLLGLLKLLVYILTPTPQKEQGCLYWWTKIWRWICCLCVDYLFKCIDASAYTLVHLEGRSYCNAAGQAISIKLGSPAQSLSVQSVNFIFNWLGRLMIAGITTLISYILLTQVDPWKKTVTSPYIPALIIFAIGLAVGSFFISIYVDASIAIYCCFLAKKGDAEHTPAQLKEFLQGLDAQKDKQK